MGALTTDPLLGSTVDGRYDVVRRIARGGMATVYLAHDRRLERYVALKVMHPHLAEGTDVIARFRREARAAARLAHPGIVAVLDQGVDGELSYLTMEYVRGRTLRTEIAGNGALSLGRSLAITEGVLDALAAAHRAGLVHRDIKPENVLVSPEGAVKVGDFGLARAVTEATAASTGTLLGTVAYLSPEIVSSGQADARADVYAVGIMLFEMLTGSPPFEGETPIQIAYRHVHEDVPAPSESVPWLPVDVDDLVAELTARDVTQRPEDAAEALALVRRLRRGLDQRALTLRAQVEGRPELLVPIPDDVPTPAERHSATMPVGGVTEELDADRTQALDRGPGTGTIALPIGAVAVPDAPSSSPAAPRRRRRGGRALVITLLVLLIAGGAGAGWWFLFGPGARVLVPEVAGTSASDATVELEDLGLVLHRDERYDDDVAAGLVISTDPEPGTSLARGESIELAVSLGIEHFTLDDVAEMPQEAAVTAVTEAGFATPDVVEEPHRTLAAGLVIRSDPGPGEYPHDQAITLTVSSGPELKEIDQDYVGWDVATATTSLAKILDIDEAAISQTEEFSDDIAAGQVISVAIGANGDVPQPYEPGATFPQGSNVILVVSKGPDMVEVPNVEGKSLSAATEQLEELGFVVDTKQSWGLGLGQVVDQKPGAGESVKRGSTILLTFV